MDKGKKRVCSGCGRSTVVEDYTGRYWHCLHCGNEWHKDGVRDMRYKGWRIGESTAWGKYYGHNNKTGIWSLMVHGNTIDEVKKKIDQA